MYEMSHLEMIEQGLLGIYGMVKSKGLAADFLTSQHANPLFNSMINPPKLENAKNI